MRFVQFMMCLCLLFGSSIHGQETEPPYLYYFSNVRNAFIIERADGTDKRLFASNIMLENTLSVGGAGWSPSGKWFAWTAMQDFFDDRKQTGYVISADGSHYFQLINETKPYVQQMMWSPLEDYLLVGYTTECCGVVDFSFELIDIAKQSVIFSFEVLSSESFTVDTYWFIEGQGVVIEYEKYDKTEFAGRYLRRMMLSGDSQEYQIEFSHGGVSKTDWIAYTDPSDHSLTLWNLVTDTRLNFETPEGKFHSGQWSHDGKYYAFQMEQDCGNPLACLSNLWLVATKSNEPIPVVENIYYQDRNALFWGEDDPILFYTSTGSFGYYHADTQATDFIIGPEWRDYAIPEFRWLDDDSIYVWSIHQSESKSLAYRYSFSTNSLSSAFVVDTSLDHNPIFSSDANIVITRGRNSYEIMNLVDNRSTNFAPHTDSMSADYLRVRWHTSNEWLITIEDVPSDFRVDAYGVVSTDGEVRREFGMCYYAPSQTCANWLPNRVELF